MCMKLAPWRYQIGLGPMPIFCASFATQFSEFATPYLSRNHVHTDGEPTSHSLPIFSDWLQTNTNILQLISNYFLPGFQNLEPNSLALITFLVMAGARVDRWRCAACRLDQYSRGRWSRLLPTVAVEDGTIVCGGSALTMSRRLCTMCWPPAQNRRLDEDGDDDTEGLVLPMSKWFCITCRSPYYDHDLDNEGNYATGLWFRWNGWTRLVVSFTTHLPDEGAGVLCRSRSSRSNGQKCRVVDFKIFCMVFVMLRESSFLLLGQSEQ